MNRAKYTAPFRKRLDELVGDPREYDALVRHRGDSQIRLVRDALGITLIELSKRMGISYSRISQLEKDEREGKIRLLTLEKAAEMMDCNLVFIFVPKADSFVGLIDAKSAS